MDTDVVLTSEIVVRPIQQMGGDHMVVAAARVSTSGEAAIRWADPARSQENVGLINYLMRHRHGTPFEHAAITFFCHAPIFVWREWHRHRIGFSYNEESGRYKKLDPVFWIPGRDRLMMVPTDHSPARPRYLRCEDDKAFDEMISRSRAVYRLCYETYEKDLAAGFALEVARRNLPLATYSACWVTCNPRSLMHFLSLRTHDEQAKFVSYPQAEIEEAARMAEQVLATGWPLTHRAFDVNGRVAP
jgi:thymidylate synthase (FAD)